MQMEPQWSTIKLALEWLKLKRLQSAAEDAEELAHTVSGNVKRYN